MLQRVCNLLKPLILALALGLALWAILLHSPALAGGPGDLDTSFGLGGVVTTPIGSGDDSGRGVAIQADGKIVVTGYDREGVYPGQVTNFGLVRYHPDGSLDTGFGSGGIVTTSINTYNFAEDVVIQADGKILVAGPIYNSGLDPDFALVRYNPDGSLDSTFGASGVVTTSFGSNADFNQALAIQEDGKIVATGLTLGGGNRADIALTRYLSDGSLDSGFGTDGKVTTYVTNGDDYGMDVAIQVDGKIVVAGRQDITGFNPGFVLVRYNSDGSLDSSFGPGGIVIPSLGGSYNYANAVAIQADGKIVIIGHDFSNFILVRYNVDGSPDSGFGASGVVTTPIGAGMEIALQTDGKIVMVGGSSVGSGSHFVVARYETDGSLDTSFGAGGIVTGPPGGSLAVAIQSDGKVVAAGSSLNGSNTIFTVVRYLGDPSLSITKSVEAAQNPVEPGDLLTYTIVVANNGSDAAEVSVDDTLPDYVIGADLHQTVALSDNQALTFTIEATVGEAAPYGVTITNTASYSYPSGSGQAAAAFTIVADTSVYLPVILKDEATP